MESTNHTRVLKLIQELAKANEITSQEKDQLKEKLMNEDSVMAQILEICHKFTDNDIKIELKNLVKSDSNNINLGLLGSNANALPEDSSPLGAALMKRKRKGKKEDDPADGGQGKKGFSLGGLGGN